MDVPIAANVLGTLGAVCWSIQLIPQIIVNYRRHNTIGLQRSMMLLWACAGVPLGAYNVASGFNVALLIQPQILTVLSLITWGQCFYYDDKWSFLQCTALTGGIGALMGGIEVALVFALQDADEKDRQWAFTLLGVLSAGLLCAGVLRHYWDIYTHRTVRGISFIFVGIDALGDVLSLISVFFQPHLDILGMVIYASEFLLWCGVFACGGYYNLTPWIKTKLKERHHQSPSLSLYHSTSGSASNGERSGARRESIENETSFGQSNDISLHRLPSSTSVFRTPSSVLVERSAGSENISDRN